MSRTHLFISTLAMSTALFAGNGYDGRFNLYSGWRQDQLNWSVQGEEGFPNVLAEIDWRNFESVLIGGKGYLAGWDHIYVKAQIDYAKFIQGKAYSSTFAANDRRDPISQSEACQIGKQIYDYKFALGGHFFPNCGPFDLAISGGYAFQALSLRFKNPFVTQSPLPDLPRFGAEGVHTCHLSHWESGFLSADGYWNAGCWTFSIQGEFHYLAYKGRGSWIYREPKFSENPILGRDFSELKWRDCASGWGQVISGTIGYGGMQGWYFGLQGGYQRFWTREGDVDINFFRERITHTIRDTVAFISRDAVLNKINWESFFVSFNFECHF